jgi:pimeloyl-ACP methyl ester carboxylesterase
MIIHTAVARLRAGKRLRAIIAALAVAALALTGLAVGTSVAKATAPKPTIVLVHGAWADASSWNGVTSRLQHDGYTVRAIPNPLRSVSGDAAYVRAFLDTLSGPIVLVGHSYGGAVITNAATGQPNVKALVYVNAFAPDKDQSPADLLGSDSALAGDPTTLFDFVPNTLPPTPNTDLYLKKSVVFASFATGLSPDQKNLVWATQRPAGLAGLSEPSGVPAWKTIPSWYLIGLKDQIIPPSSQRAMAEHAGSTIATYDAGHLGLISDPRTVTGFIERAAKVSVRVR